MWLPIGGGCSVSMLGSSASIFDAQYESMPKKLLELHNWLVFLDP